jgi:tetratricopeptide (TPR) repeat protein
MANQTNSLLSKGNRAFASGRYDDAVRFYKQALHHFPTFEKSINFNIALAEARISGESLTQSIFRKEMARYTCEAEKELKKPITILILTSDHNQYDIDTAYSAAEILEKVVTNVVIACLQRPERKKFSLSYYQDKSIPIIPLCYARSDTFFKRLFKNITPDMVFYCGPQILTQDILKTIEEKITSLILIKSKDTPTETEKTFSEQVSYIDFKRIFIDLDRNSSPYKKIKSLLNHAPKGGIALRKNIGLHNQMPSEGKNIVIFWKQNDTGLYGRRPDMVAKYLASREDIRKVLIIDAPITEYELNSKKYGSSLTHDRDIYMKTYEKIFCQLDNDKVFHYVYVSRNLLSYDEAYEKVGKSNFPPYKEYLERVFNEEGITPQDSTFWFYPKNYFAADIINVFRPKKVVVDVVDDHRAWPGVSTGEKEKLTKHYRDILTKAHICIANCQAVADSMKEYNSSILVIPNGCEEQHELIEPIDNRVYNEIKEFKGKILGFVGNLESKIDIVLLEKLANQFTDSLIVLIGSTHANPRVRDLQRHPNIKIMGVVEYKYINAIVRRFAVGIVPHLKTDLTMNMNPLKVFVYATNRIPIVCSDVDNLPEAEFIHTGRTHEEFLEKCDRLLNQGIKSDDNSYAKFIGINSWRSRLTHLADQI